MRAPTKFLIHATLIAGAIVFVMPFAWMLSTALKPLDQTLAQPPKWLPMRHEARDAGGSMREVIPGDFVDEPSVWVRPAGATRPIAVPAASVHDALWQPPGGGEAVLVEVLKTVPATAAQPWREVLDARTSQTDIIPAAAIRSTVSFRWGNFRDAIRAMGDFPRYLANTVILCVLNVAGTVFSSALAAYGFSRVAWRGREQVFKLVLASMMIPFPVIMVPVYGLFRSLGMIGTLQPLWVGSFFTNAFNIFLLRQFFRTIPNDISEAARIDGCGEFRIFWQIILPHARPALAVVAVFTFLATWNDFLGPLIFLTDQKDYTLALALQSFQSRSGGTAWHHLMAASTIVILPVITLFVLAQRTFVEGIAFTGGKQ